MLAADDRTGGARLALGDRETWRGGELAAPRELEPRELAALGLSADDAPVWLLGDERRPACRLEPGAIRVLVGEDPWEKTPLLVRDVSGACDVGGLEGRLAVQQAEEPVGCRVVRPRGVDAALATTAGAPAALREALEGRGCHVGCEPRASSVGVASGRRRVEWSVSTHVRPEPAQTECSWEREDVMALLARDGEGPVIEVRAADEEPYGLDEVVLAGETIVAFVDRAPRRIHVWGWPEGGQPRLARRREVRWAHDEDREHQSLAEGCDP